MTETASTADATGMTEPETTSDIETAFETVLATLAEDVAGKHTRELAGRALSRIQSELTRLRVNLDDHHDWDRGYCTICDVARNALQPQTEKDAE